MAATDNGKSMMHVDNDMSFKKNSPLAEEIMVMTHKPLQKKKPALYKPVEDDMGWYIDEEKRWKHYKVLKTLLRHYGFFPTFPSISYFTELGRLNNTARHDSDSEFLIPTPWSDESKNEKSQKDLVKMPSEAVEDGMDDHVPDEIDGAKGEHGPNNVGKKGKSCTFVVKPKSLGDLVGCGILPKGSLSGLRSKSNQGFLWVVSEGEIP
uniref:Uncharacterized protein n=1 Tax=Tanacetum cinerariifolium TaxID=118510 RepID=A0A6L2KUW8_TANCI|nr:hypothetical protein [Tanacetum cinerariifolium]